MTKTNIRCLSVQQPWNWLIVYGHKDVENREWTTQYRGPLLIHTGKKPALDASWVPTQRFCYSDRIKHLLPQDAPTSFRDVPFGGIVGIATLVDVVQKSDSPWFCGTYGWIVKDASPLPFFPLRGMPGLFDVELEPLLEHIKRHQMSSDVLIKRKGVII